MRSSFIERHSLLAGDTLENLLSTLQLDQLVLTVKTLTLHTIGLRGETLHLIVGHSVDHLGREDVLEIMEDVLFGDVRKDDVDEDFLLDLKWDISISPVDGEENME